MPATFRSAFRAPTRTVRPGNWLSTTPRAKSVLCCTLREGGGELHGRVKRRSQTSFVYLASFSGILREGLTAFRLSRSWFGSSSGDFQAGRRENGWHRLCPRVPCRYPSETWDSPRSTPTEQP